MGLYPKFVGGFVTTQQEADLDQLVELTGESRSAILRRALDRLLVLELPQLLAQAGRNGLP